MDDAGPTSGTTQYFTATSIDGYIADPDNSLDWLFEAHDETHGEGRWEAFIGAVGAMGMGATTYEWVLEHERLLDEPEKWHAFYDDIPCWVFSHRELPPIPGADLRFVRGDVRPVHEAMKAAAGNRNIWLVGGGDLVGQFADRGLLDEIQLHVAPVTLGAGAPLLPRRITSPRLTLRGVEEEGGFAYLTYAVTGDQPPGDRA
jgi:dihydrofolate reductase